MDERGAVHGLSGAALGEKPWEVQRELQLAFKSPGQNAMAGPLNSAFFTYLSYYKRYRNFRLY